MCSKEIIDINNPELVAQVKLMIENGFPLTKISVKLNLSVYYIRKIIKIYDIKRSFRCFNICRYKRNKIKELWMKNYSAKEIANCLNISGASVNRIRKEMGLPNKKSWTNINDQLDILSNRVCNILKLNCIMTVRQIAQQINYKLSTLRSYLMYMDISRFRFLSTLNCKYKISDFFTYLKPSCVYYYSDVNRAASFIVNKFNFDICKMSPSMKASFVSMLKKAHIERRLSNLLSAAVHDYVAYKWLLDYI